MSGWNAKKPLNITFSKVTFRGKMLVSLAIRQKKNQTKFVRLD
jgi:hypothetical protein